MAALRDRIAAFLNPPPIQPAPGVSPVRMDDAAVAMRGVIRGSYDAVARTPENMRHWQWADHLSSDASLRPEVRSALRSQSRYELSENNAYGRGLVETIVTDTIGSGPRLQITQFDQTVNQAIEKAWHCWCEAVGYGDKLEVDYTSRVTDGESVIRFINNVTIEDPVQLDLQLIECDQLATPNWEPEITDNYVDGVHLDRFGNPYAYDILRYHPGNRGWATANNWQFDQYSYTQLIHNFKQTRAGQHRGIPEFTPALPLFAFLRRFTLATISAAETAASVSQVIETDAPIPEELETEYAANTFDKWMDSIPVDRNSATVLPNMWKLRQFAAEHPTTTYAMFKREIIAEISRCVCVPTNVATNDSSGSNMASARFDRLGYERKVRKEQRRYNRKINDRVFSEWIVEAALVGSIPRRAANFVIAANDKWGGRGLSNALAHTWHWDGLRDADEKDAADAQKTRLQNGSTHRAREYASQGLDVEVEDQKAADSFGVSVEEYREQLMMSIFANGNLMKEESTDGPAPTETNEEAESERETEDATT